MSADFRWDILRNNNRQCSYLTILCNVETLRPRQNGRRFPDNIFKCIFLNEDVCLSIKISLKFVPKGPMNNIPALVHFLTYICVIRPQRGVLVTKEFPVLHYLPRLHVFGHIDTIPVTSHRSHGVSDNHQFDSLFNRLYRLITKQAQYYWPFVKETTSSLARDP